MLKNYLKIAFKVMMRRKFVSAVTLLIIALYLMMATIGASFFDITFNDYPPINDKDKILIIQRMDMAREGERARQYFGSFHFYQQYIRTMKTPQYIALSRGRGFSLIKAKRKTGCVARFVNQDFWDILDFKFLEGAPFTQEEEDRKIPVVIISQSMRDRHFEREGVLGENLEINGVVYKVKGVVEDMHAFNGLKGEAYAPFTTDPDLNSQIGLPGPYTFMLKGTSSSDQDKMKSEFQTQLAKVSFPNPDRFNTISGEALTFGEQFMRGSMGRDGEGLIILLFVVLVVMFAIPASSLLSINISRISERNSEIGIRKSFGATIGHLVSQFVIENIVFSLIGGLLGFGLAVVMAEWVVRPLFGKFGAVFPPGYYIFNGRMFLISLIICLLYGLATGVIPAWKMAKSKPVMALKG